jgi:hypothetical protein
MFVVPYILYVYGGLQIAIWRRFFRVKWPRSEEPLQGCTPRLVLGLDPRIGQFLVERDFLAERSGR